MRDSDTIIGDAPGIFIVRMDDRNDPSRPREAVRTWQDLLLKGLERDRRERALGPAIARSLTLVAIMSGLMIAGLVVLS